MKQVSTSKKKMGDEPNQGNRINSKTWDMDKMVYNLEINELEAMNYKVRRKIIGRRAILFNLNYNF